MFVSLLAVAAFQLGPFYQQREDYRAVRPFYAAENGETDVLWPVFTVHRDWWRFCYFLGGQRDVEGHQGFYLLPFWYNGRDAEKGDYWGLFPFFGTHPHALLMHDIRYVLWPFWMEYSMPRPRDRTWLRTETVLFPFISWRSDGAWSVWPFYGVNYQRESDHRYALWPLVTWADYRADRDTAGAGFSWMAWPFYGRVKRERESQHLVLPPFFSFAATFRPPKSASGGKSQPAPESLRVRCPWPLFEYETTPSRERLSVWPFYENVTDCAYRDRKPVGHVRRFGWKLVELYDDETRVFPFYASGRNHFRIWPLWESETKDDVTVSRTLALFPIRWVPAVDRNWSKFWTFYERETTPVCTDHSLFWGLIRWRTY